MRDASRSLPGPAAHRPDRRNLNSIMRRASILDPPDPASILSPLGRGGGDSATWWNARAAQSWWWAGRCYQRPAPDTEKEMSTEPWDRDRDLAMTSSERPWRAA